MKTSTASNLIMGRFTEWLAPPKFAGEEQKTRRARIINVVTLMGLLYLSVTIPVLLLEDRTHNTTLLVHLIILVVSPLFKYLLHQGKVTFVAGASMILLFVWVTTLSLNRGIISTPSTAAYLFLVIVSGMLFEWRGVLAAGLASSLAVLGLILAANAGLLPQPDQTVPYMHWITYTFLIGLTGGLGLYENLTIRKALQRAQTEIGRRKTAELELRKLLRAVEQSPASIMITNLDGMIEYVNPRFSQVTGYSFDEVLGKNPRILKTERTLAGTHSNLWATVLAGSEWRGEFVNRKKDGSLYYESAVISPISDQDGIPTHYLAVKEDITARKQAETALRESEARWQFALEGAGDGIWDWNTQSNKVFFSRQWKAMLGYEEDEIGDSLDEWEKRIHPDDIEAVLAKIDDHFKARTASYISEHRVRCRNGTYKWILDRGKVVEWTEDQKPIRVIGTHTDISERKWMEQQLRESEAQNRAIIASVPDLLFHVRSDGLILAYHAPHGSLLSEPLEAFLNKRIEDVLPPDITRSIMDAIGQSLAAGQMVMLEYEMELNRAVSHFENRIVPFSQGQVLSVIRDITERKQTEDDLRQSREMYRLLAENISDVIWILDVSTGMFRYVSPSVERLRGYTVEEVMAQGMESALTLESLQTLQEQIPSRIKAFQEGERIFYIDELLQPHKDGSLVWTEATTSFQINEANGHLEVYGVSRVIRERKQAEEKLRRQNQHLSLLHQVTLDLLNHRDVDELLQAIVDRAVTLLDAPFGELMLEKHGELVVQTFTQNQMFLQGDRVGPYDARLSWQAFETKQPVVVDDYSVYPARRELYSGCDLHAVADFPVLVREKCIGVLSVGRSRPGHVFSETEIGNGMLFAQLFALVLDSAQLYSAAEYEIAERSQVETALRKANDQLRIQLAEIEELQAELREQSLRDPLTGLYNRRYLNEMLAREITRARREQEQLSIIVSDIDHFKAINDTYGHRVGDEFLVQIARLLKVNARASDVVCRYGGEEFLLVIPGASMTDASRRADQIRQKCEAIVLEHDGHKLSITMSFGVATYPIHGLDADDVVNKADKALYHSKQTGRNKVSIWHSNP